MNTLTFAISEKGVVVTGKTFAMKDALKAAGASWDPAAMAWIFRGQTDAEAIRSMIMAPIEELAAAAKAKRKEELAAAKVHREWLKTPEGAAHARAEARARVVATRASIGGGWICCDDCTVIDWGRKHTCCNTHEFRVRGMVYTGD